MELQIILALIFSHVGNFTGDLYFFIWLQLTVEWPFVSIWRTPFSISLWEDLVVMNSLSFCLSENVLIFPSVLKDSFAGYWILDWQVFFFSFQHFKYVISLPSKFHGFWWENICLPYWGALVPGSLLPYSVKILFLSFDSLTIMCLSV